MSTLLICVDQAGSCNMPKRKIFRDSDSDADPEEDVESPNENSPASSDGKSS